MSQVGQELAAIPFDELITSMGLGIAKAQLELDKHSTQIAHLMSGANDSDRVTFDNERLSLMELGLTPSFYQFVESTIEIKIVVKMTTSETTETTTHTVNEKKERVGGIFGFGSKVKSVQTTTVDAKYARKYDYSVEGSSLVRTKLVPVPPPAILQERIRLMMERDEKERAAKGS